ncbi:MAG: phosphonate ABC transporter, permease protein PhnE, partial [Caulobacter sp.]|nr:phosphonate ABC transporter, permease protein PhnE [Caulobacter sp.]
MSDVAMKDAGVPAPPKRSASALAFDTLLWGGVILLLVVSFKPAE